MNPFKRAGLLAFTVAASGTIALAAAPTVRARGWAPLVRLAAGDGPDAPTVAVTRIRAALATIHAVLYGLDVDEPTRVFFAKVMEQLESFDLAALYETLPESSDDGWRSVGFTGHQDGGKYVIRRVEAGKPAKLEPDSAAFGDVAFRFRSRHAAGEGNDDFVGNGRANVGVGQISWRQFLGALAETIRLVESGAPGGARGDAPRPSPEAIAQVKKDNPKLGPEDLEVVAVFRESFPRVYEHLRTLYRTDDVLVFDPDESDWKQVHLVLAVRRDSAEENYPALWKWISGWGPLAAGRLEVTDEKGRVVATFRFSTKDLSITLDAFFSHGKLCPVEGGKVLVDEGYDLESTGKAHHRDRWSFDMDVNGITTEIRDFVVKVAYEKTNDGMQSRLVCDEEPKVRVHGSAFGVIPTWAIDVVMPSNMEDLTRNFLRVVTRGNDGKGLVVDLAQRGSASGNVLELENQAEGLNNFLVRLAFKVARRKLVPPDEAVQELAGFFRAGHDAFTADLEAFAAGK